MKIKDVTLEGQRLAIQYRDIRINKDSQKIKDLLKRVHDQEESIKMLIEVADQYRAEIRMLIKASAKHLEQLNATPS